MARGRLCCSAALIGIVVVLIFGTLLEGETSAHNEDFGFPQVYPDPSDRVVKFLGKYHNLNNLLLHVSNMGFFGDWNSDPTSPSAEWPAGSGIEYLFAAGLWVGGVVYDEFNRPDTLVSAAVYQLEYYPKPDARDVIYKTAENEPGGSRIGDGADDDDDNLVDEDWLDGYDNDGDGFIDEDFAAISQQMYTCTFYDTTTLMNANRTEDFHKPLNLRVRQESYAWGGEAAKDFIGVEYKVTNIGDSTIYQAYVAFMVDADIGPVRQVPTSYTDDMAAFIDTTVKKFELNLDTGKIEPNDYDLTIGYMYDYPGGDDGDVPGYIGVMFLGHTVDETGRLAPQRVEIHMFRSWSSGEEDPQDDKERYRYMRGNSDFEQTIDPPTTKPQDYRFLVSAGPFARIPPGSTLVFQVAFVCGHPFDDFIDNAAYAQKIYNGRVIDDILYHWVGSSPPPPPNQMVIPSDGKVIIEWDDYSERVPDPLEGCFDFAGYRIWRADGWRHESEVPTENQWKLIAHYDLDDLPAIDTGLEGVGKYRYIDSVGVHNGLPYWYAVTAFDDGRAFRFVVDPETDRMDSIPFYGSYAQAQKLVYPRAEPARRMGKVRIVPNPYPWNPSNPTIPDDLRESHRAIGDMVEYEGDPSGRRVTFVGLPRKSMVRVYTLAGDLVWSKYFEGPNDPITGAPPQWNLVSRNNQEIVSGIYIVHVESPYGSEITKFVVVR